MYTGHFALGVALKARFPAVNPYAVFLGVGLLDLIDGVLIDAGADRVAPSLAAGPYLFFRLLFIDWDHSLVMALVWSLAFALLFRRDALTAAVAAAAVFSHWLADLVVHNDDLALYPHSGTHVGLGLWGSLGVWSWVFEGGFCLALFAYAGKRAPHSTWLRGAAIVIAFLFVSMSPWLSPMKLVAATVPMPAAALLHGAMVTAGFLIPGLVIASLVHRSDLRAAVATAGR